MPDPCRCPKPPIRDPLRRSALGAAAYRCGYRSWTGRVPLTMPKPSERGEGDRLWHARKRPSDSGSISTRAVRMGGGHRGRNFLWAGGCFEFEAAGQDGVLGSDYDRVPGPADRVPVRLAAI